MQEIVYWFKDYYADYVYLVFTLIAATFLMLLDRKKYAKVVIPSIVLFIVLFNPVLYKYILVRARFWRLFWTIPGVFIVALAFIELISRREKVIHKVAITICTVLLVMVTGHNVFLGASRGDDSNVYRLSNETVMIGQMMLERDESPRCILPAGLLSSMRLYSGDIEPMYGRNAQNYINRASQEVLDMYNVMESASPDYDYVLSRAEKWGYNFVVTLYAKPIDDSVAERYGYDLLATVNEYNVYYNSRLDETVGGMDGYDWVLDDIGWKYQNSSGNYVAQTIQVVNGISYYFNREGYVVDAIDGDTATKVEDGDLIITQIGDDDYPKPTMFYTIDDQAGHFYIIDGGQTDQVDQVIEQIRLYGGVVDGWILTHPHDDHIGAFNEIYDKYKDEVEIKKIYAIDLDSEYYHEVANEWDAIEYYDRFNELMSDKSNPNYNKVEYVKRGKTYKDGELSFKVYNTFTEESYNIKTGSLPNAATMAFEVFGEDDSMLFLGDLEQGNADLMVELFGNELEAGFMQAAHHGQNVDFEFYEKIKAHTVTVDAPAWLRLEDPDFHTAYEHLQYFNEKGLDVITYDTTPNVIILK